MRAVLLACAALALAPAAPGLPPAHAPTRLDHIKSQILAKLGLSSRPTPMGAPPRDVVRQILARAADPQPPQPEPDPAQSMREIIAIAHRGTFSTNRPPSEEGGEGDSYLFYVCCLVYWSNSGPIQKILF